MSYNHHAPALRKRREIRAKVKALAILRKEIRALRPGISDNQCEAIALASYKAQSRKTQTRQSRR
jgi:hypothetical protein